MHDRIGLRESPDEINRIGQDWGLPPWIPQALPQSRFMWTTSCSMR